MGYHPYNTNELPDEDLPWAGVILPPGNTGSAGVSKSVKFQPGDTVIGFFLDGENAQIPMIFGCYNSQYAVKDGENFLLDLLLDIQIKYKDHQQLQLVLMSQMMGGSIKTITKALISKGREEGR